jgi:tetraacyldisaccharide 4'-kinase
LEVVTASAAADVGDEPLLIHHACKVPVIVAANRVQAARTLLAAHPDCNILISDDGLQHRALGRDIEIVVFDDRGVGNGALLPAGPLREPWPRAAGCKTQLMLKNIPRSLNPYAKDGAGKRYAINDLKSKKLHALAGIAKPESFFQMLRSQGLVLASATAYSDHHPLSKVKMPLDGLLICTEKDAVKLWPRHPEILAIGLQVELDATFLAVFDASVACLASHHLH